MVKKQKVRNILKFSGQAGKISLSGLLFVAIIAGIGLAAYSRTALAGPPQTGTGSIGLTGKVNGPAPTTPAVILHPANGSKITSTPVTVSGTCPLNTVVKIYKNEVFGGAVDCTESGNFSLEVDLFAGQNTLIARVIDALDQQGPDSATVTVNFDEPVNIANVTRDAAQPFFLKTDVTSKGVDPNQEYLWYAQISGGLFPYAISWDWGDGKTDLLSVSTAGQFSAKHTYTKPGVYKIVLRGTDSAGNKAYLQTVVIVNGTLSANSKVPAIFRDNGILLMLWPLYLLILLMIISFWLGERYEKKRLQTNWGIA